EGDQHALQPPVERDVDDGLLDDLELAAHDAHRVEEHRGQHDPDDPQEAGERTERESRNGRRDGHPESQAGHDECRDDAEKRRVRCGDAQVNVALLIPVAMQRDEIQQRQDRDGGNECGEENIAQRVVRLLVHDLVLSMRGSRTLLVRKALPEPILSISANVRKRRRTARVFPARGKSAREATLQQDRQPNGAGANSRASARHTCSAVSGIWTRSASRPSPAWDSASITAVTTVGVAPMVPSSPTPFAPSALVVQGTEVSNSVLKPRKQSTCGSA